MCQKRRKIYYLDNVHETKELVTFMLLEVLHSQQWHHHSASPENSASQPVLKFLLYAADFQPSSTERARSAHRTQFQCALCMFYLLPSGLTQVGKKLPNQAPDPKLAFYSERWGQRCIIHILVHNTEAKLFSEVSPVWKLLPPSLPTPKTYRIFTRATSIRPTSLPPLFFWYKLCKTFVLRTFFPPQTNEPKK